MFRQVGRVQAGGLCSDRSVLIRQVGRDCASTGGSNKAGAGKLQAIHACGSSEVVLLSIIYGMN